MSSLEKKFLLLELHIYRVMLSSTKRQNTLLFPKNTRCTVKLHVVLVNKLLIIVKRTVILSNKAHFALMVVMLKKIDGTLPANLQKKADLMKLTRNFLFVIKKLLSLSNMTTLRHHPNSPHFKTFGSMDLPELENLVTLMTLLSLSTKNRDQNDGMDIMARISY